MNQRHPPKFKTHPANFAAHLYILFAVCALLAPGALRAATLSFPVKASIQGNATLQTIGNIVANDRFPGKFPTSNPSGLTATFTFDPQFSFLDASYEFDWVQIEKSYVVLGSRVAASLKQRT